MSGTARLYFDAAVALAIMATLGAISGFVAFAATGERAVALLTTIVVFALTGAVATLRLWRQTRKPALAPHPATEPA